LDLLAVHPCVGTGDFRAAVVSTQQLAQTTPGRGSAELHLDGFKTLDGARK
jgi:hypothetical protein